MRNLILIFLLLTSFISYGQKYDNPGNYGLQYKRLKADSSFKVPVLTDTVRLSTLAGNGDIIYVESPTGSPDTGFWVIENGAYVKLNTTTPDIQTTLLGTIYSAASWSNLDTFYTPMSGITIDGNDDLVFTTGTLVADSFLGLDRKTLLDHWDMTAKVIVGSKSSTSLGMGLGMKGAAGYPTSIFTTFNMTDHTTKGGKLYFRYNNSDRDSSAAKISFSIGDTLVYRCWYDYDKVAIFASIHNLRNDSTASLYFDAVEAETTINGNSQLTYSSGYLSVFAQGGTFTLDSLNISSKTLRYADLAVIGDSKSWNADVTNMTKYAWVKQVKLFYVNTAVLAGTGELVIDVINRLPEIIELRPRQVLLNIGFNSFFAGVPNDTINTQYATIVDSLENNGIRVIKMLPQYDQQDQSTLRTFILANYAEEDIIDLYAITAACGDACLDFNRIHPNDSGSTIIAKGILDAGKIWYAKGTDGIVDMVYINGIAALKDSLVTARTIFVPYTGATGTVNLGSQTLTALYATLGGARFGTGGGSSTTNVAAGLTALPVNTTGTYNVAVGNEAMRINVDGADNVAIGGLTLYTNVSGARNVAVGTNALRTNTGTDNLGVGNSALRANTTGLRNVAFGTNALTTNTTATDNTGIGYDALRTVAGNNHYNTSIGANSLRQLATGTGNIAMGYFAGYRDTAANNLTSADFSVFLGYDARANAVGQTNQIVIGANARGRGSNTTAIGNSSTVVTKLFGRLLIGTVPEYADNAAALLGGLIIGEVYRTGDDLKVVH